MATIVGVAWYEPREWGQLRAIAPDRDKLEATYGEWLTIAETGVRDLRAAGYQPHRVPVTIPALLAWCDAVGRVPDASARAEYASAELQRRYEAGLLDHDA